MFKYFLSIEEKRATEKHRLTNNKLSFLYFQHIPKKIIKITTVDGKDVTNFVAYPDYLKIVGTELTEIFVEYEYREEVEQLHKC